MTTFTINEQNEIVAFGTPGEAAATPFDSFSSQQELTELATAWPTERLVAIWNGLTRGQPVKGFPTTKAGASRIWARIQKLGDSKLGAPIRKPKSNRSGRGGAPGAKGATAKGKTTNKARAPKSAPQAKKAAKAPKNAAPREGSKTAQVVAMLQRKNGATLVEIMDTMGWQKHTVRGFMAGAMKKAGYKVESFKPDGAERTYRIKR
jgi:Protein of unknown function (DUF3489)